MENRPWFQQYAPYVPHTIDFEQYDSVAEFVDEKLKTHANKIAFECMGKTITYKEVDDLANDFGAYLQSRGIKAGDKFSIMLPNLLQFPVALIACLRIGVIPVNTNPLYTPREMEHQFVDSDVKGILIAENFASNLEEIIKHTQIETVITTGIGDMLGGLKGIITNFVVKKVKKMVPAYKLPTAVKFKSAIKTGKSHSIKRVKTTQADVILHQYTGGTTGVAKGAMLTNRNILSNLLQIDSWMPPVDDVDQLNVLTPLPMYHIFAFTASLLSMMNQGAKNILVVNPRDLPKLVGEFKKNKINVFWGVNTLFNALNLNKEFQALDFSPLRIVVAGGMALQNNVAKEWKEITGVSISEGFGLTESSPVVTVNPINDVNVGTIGLPVPGTDVRIVAEDGTICGPEERGEMQVKGPQVMKGYYNRPEETAKTFDGEWLKTGDIAVMQEDGYFKIVDRKKDMILVSGFNVYPNEVEDVIANMTEVDEVCAVGKPSDRSGEVVKVFIIKKQGTSLTEDQVIKYCRENLTGYKIPKEVEFRTELPKTTVGKILRKELRNEELKKAGKLS